MYENKADATILDKYDEIRRQKWLDVIDVVSSSNLRRLFETDPERAVETDDFFQMLKKAETDPAYSQELQNVSIFILLLGKNSLRTHYDTGGQGDPA